ncbi:hypothetical protein ACWZEH_26765 [Streptomyces sp. QTS137]
MRSAVDALATSGGRGPRGDATAALGLRLTEVAVTDGGLRAGPTGGRAEPTRPDR